MEFAFRKEFSLNDMLWSVQDFSTHMVREAQAAQFALPASHFSEQAARNS